MTRKTKMLAAVAPLLCLICPAHLIGYLAAAGLGWEGSNLATGHHEAAEAASVLVGLSIAALLVRRWERRRHHHHCDHH